MNLSKSIPENMNSVSFPRRLRVIRTLAGFNQHEAAEAIGCGYSTYQAWERENGSYRWFPCNYFRKRLAVVFPKIFEGNSPLFE
jgi:transcriptional regulator with XRE-family HTH domain